VTRAKEPLICVLLPSDWAAAGLVEDVRRGLGCLPRSLPPTWLYDDRGSALFDLISRLPDYYPAEAERSILREQAEQTAHLSGATTVVELDSGTGVLRQMICTHPTFHRGIEDAVRALA
jgi:L-histidine N-alpha-methyltransferase